VNREIKIQTSIAQRSQRTNNQGLKILEQASKFKAQKNEITGMPKFTAFNSQPFDKLSKIINSCKIKLGNEIEAHLAIDRLKAHEAANAAILEAKKKSQQEQSLKNSANRFVSLEVDPDIEKVRYDKTEEQIEEKPDSSKKTENEPQKSKAPKRGRPRKHR